MSFLGNVLGGVKNAVTQAVKGTVGKAVDAVSDLVSGQSGSGTNPVTFSNAEKAASQVFAAYVAAAKKKYAALGMNPQAYTPLAIADAKAYVLTTAGKAAIAKVEAELNKGSNPQGSTVVNILKTLLDSAVKGVSTGVTTGISTSLGTNVAGLINKGAAAIVGTKPVKSAQETLADLGASTLGKTITAFIKKYWFYLIVPFGISALLLVKLFQSVFKGKAGARKSARTPYKRR